MQTRFIVALLASLLSALGAFAGDCFAAPDDYIGDSNIYVGSTDQRARPNVLFILDTSLATLNRLDRVLFVSVFVYRAGDESSRNLQQGFHKKL